MYKCMMYKCMKLSIKYNDVKILRQDVRYGVNRYGMKEIRSKNSHRAIKEHTKLLQVAVKHHKLYLPLLKDRTLLYSKH